MRDGIASFLLVGSVAAGCAFGATYHVANDGADANTGLAPDAAWATLERVNAGPFQAGDKILFKRGGVWRGQIKAQSGSEAGYVTYGAYGEGAKPLLLGSVARNNPADWTAEAGGVWSTGGPNVLKRDVGNIIFGNDEACGVKVWKEADLKRQGDYWYDLKSHVVKLRSDENPAKRYGRIELAIRDHNIDQGGRCYVAYENLAVKYGAAHGIGGGNTHHIIVRGCDFGFIGGGDQYSDGRTVRFGNGVEFWATAHDALVENCRFWEIYDAALTNQSSGPKTPQYNITYRNNVIWNSEYSFEYWNRPLESETYNIRFVNNTCVNAGHGWGHAQRPDPSGRHLCFYNSPSAARDIVIRNNIFYEAKGNAFYAPGWTKAQIDALAMDNNCWHQAEGTMIAFKDAKYTLAEFAKYQAAWNKEPHSLCAVPKFVDAVRAVFHLAADSPCIDAGCGEEGRAADFDGTPVPQGKAPDIGAYERK